MYSRGETRFKPLALNGKQKVTVAPTDRLCTMPGCFKYINAGDNMVRWASYDVHTACAAKWCDERGIDHEYSIKENA